MTTQFKHEDAYAFAELLELLNYMDNSELEKIPKKLIDIFKANALTNYENHLNPDIPLEEQELTPKTISYLGILCLNYWCKDEEEKQTLLHQAHLNDLKREKELNEKYSYKNIFNNQKSENSEFYYKNISSEKNKLDQSSNIENLPIDFNNFPWYKKIFTKIKRFFNKLFNKAKTPT